MNVMTQAMLKAGLETRIDTVGLDQGALTLVSQNINKLARRTAAGSLMNLQAAQTVGEFKDISRDLLLVDHSSETVNEVCKLAHNLQHLDGGKKLIWLVLATRKNLAAVQSERKSDVIRRAFRSSNPKTNIPPEWMR